MQYGPPRHLHPEHAAYLAGFFDGEGSIIRVGKYGWRVVVYQASEPVLQWIVDVTGTGAIHRRESTGRNLVKKPVLRMHYYWQIYGDNAMALLRQLLPYLIVKRDKAVEAISASGD